MENPFPEMERHNRVPRAFLLLFFGLIAWGVCYIAAYTPEFSGWSQYKVLRKETEAEKKVSGAAAPLEENPYGKDPKSIAEGQGIYREHCSGCHGKFLKGDVGPDLTSHLKYGESDTELYLSVSEGRPRGMPDFADPLGRDRIWKILAYVDSVRGRRARP